LETCFNAAHNKMFDNISKHLVATTLALSLKLSCPSCNDGNPIQRAYTNLSKNSILLYVHTYKSANLCMLTRIMHYWCLCCKEVISGAKGRLLVKLSAHVRAAYPASPEYGIGKNTSFQVAQDVACGWQPARKHKNIFKPATIHS
jgi:hypothetical protein